MLSENDTRGWIMSCISGIACAIGSGLICVDVIAQYLGKKDFRIAESDVFLSSSLSLSGGVVLFTALYSMLPTSKAYLTRAGYSPQLAAYTLIALFFSGIIVINIFSTLLHRWMPSHVVSCGHSHSRPHKAEDIEQAAETANNAHPETTETTPLLPHSHGAARTSGPAASHQQHNGELPQLGMGTLHKPSVTAQLSEQLTRIMGGSSKPSCANGKCFGVSQACGLECRKLRVQVESGEITDVTDVTQPAANDRDVAPQSTAAEEANSGHHIEQGVLGISSSTATTAYAPSPPSEQPSAHHHHVPQNAFLSIGLQTSLAIALHKLPEGFITYATNHTNPTLGWSVFVAISIHNITEGFAMSLPLYLALKSRLKAIIWSSLLGGISQPAGAGIAALWIWGSSGTGRPINDGHPDGPSSAVYGCMFAITAGVMTNVGLQLFAESMMLSHRRGLCIGFAFAGMGIIGLSFALTAT
ncbi:ZIP metal ion transporter [Trichophyton interdigitale]|uniref:ZIP metal ion transporter n=1 Tax=Trichophyton interdigitale TaxID=101480 RepID=A0A9P5D0P8_9EURO|nr:ZIP metal ion transporter [Trichophyton interdigitale]KAF3901184.1 ZIP metal ion transporter [Trichophyton interdigitale]KAG8212154.1 ZIP metal ion transporter [Trichophyton interdigitale]